MSVDQGMHHSRRALAYAVTVAALTVSPWTPPSPAFPADALELDRVDAMGVLNYWSLDRLKRARPLRSPEPQTPYAPGDSTATEPADVGEAEGEGGKGPTVLVRPDMLNRLFDPGEGADLEAENAGSSENVEYGSDVRGGSSAGAWVQNFGVLASGQSGGVNSGTNRVIGVTSYGYTSTDPLVQGSSIPDSRFIDLLNLACTHRGGNC
jgi:hypothetical protein